GAWKAEGSGRVGARHHHAPGRENRTKEAAIASLARMKAEAELASLYRERQSHAPGQPGATRTRAELRMENRTGDEKRAAIVGGSKGETGRCQSPGRWFDASLNDLETLTRA